MKSFFKKARTILLSILIISLFLLPLVKANDHADTNLIEHNAEALVNLQILRGDEHGNLKLNDNVSRCEFTTLIIRILGKEGESDLNSTDNNTENLFTDVSEKHWAYGNIITALKYGLINGYEDKTFRPDNNVTFTEARAIIVRALGYESHMEGKWPENVINMSKKLGLDYNIDLPQDKEITRGEASVLIYNSLTIPYAK